MRTSGAVVARRLVHIELSNINATPGLVTVEVCPNFPRIFEICIFIMDESCHWRSYKDSSK